MKDFYYILGTGIHCTQNELMEAYQKLSKKFHPDLNQDDGYFESRFREISEAYETLSDPVKRGQYDVALINAGLYMPEKTHKKVSVPLKAKHIDRAFTIILILITVLFGYYVYLSVKGPAKKTVNKEAAAVTRVSKHHKRKHALKAKSSNTVASIIKPFYKPAVVIADTAIRPVQPIRKSIIKHDSKPPVNNDAPLYTTYIKSNVTGVVYMRNSDDYGSSVVQLIPTNSQVAVLEKGKSFYKVLFNNKPGYVPMWTIQTK